MGVSSRVTSEVDNEPNKRNQCSSGNVFQEKSSGKSIISWFSVCDKWSIAEKEKFAQEKS